MAKKNLENPDQTILDIDAATDTSPNLSDGTDFWPSEEEAQNVAPQGNQPLLAKTALRPVIESINEPKISDFRLNQLSHQAISMFPDDFRSKKVLTPELDERISKMSRDGNAMGYSTAFEIVMGFPFTEYQELKDEPNYSFSGKSPAYIEQAEIIFKNPYPKASHKAELRILRKELKPLLPGIEALRLRGEFDSEDNSEELLAFVTWRLNDIEKLLRK